MKLFVILSLIGLTFCQDVEHPTLDATLRQSQQELTHAHEFAEEFSVDNRDVLSNILLQIERRIVGSFMDAYANIKIHAIEVRRIMTEDYPEPSFCKNRVRERWELQVTRYGQKLGQCLGVADGYIKQFTQVLNDLHVESRTYSNVIPNCGVHTFAELNIFDARDDLSQYINNRLRDVFFRAYDRIRGFEEYVNDIWVDMDEIVRQLTSCFRSLPNTFVNESNQDLELIRQCYSD